MEMSEILDRAKELAAQYEANGYIHRDATLLLPELVAECEFWRQKAIEERAKRRAYFADACHFDPWDVEENRDQYVPVSNEAIEKEKQWHYEQAERELEEMR